MKLLVQRDQVAQAVFLVVVIAAAGAEVAATYFGQARDGRRRVGGSLAEALLLVRRRDGASANDRWTKQILIGAVLCGMLGAYALAAGVPSLRAYADNWWTLGVGVTLMLAGIAMRSSAVWTLGRYFRREVTVEADQPLIRTGPYRWVRHPAYCGNLLTYVGFGLALGSWLSAALLAAFALLGLLPRIQLEERSLEQAFGSEYTDYKLTTARLIPYVW